jgi:short-subunit dehydrogenase
LDIDPRALSLMEATRNHEQLVCRRLDVTDSDACGDVFEQLRHQLGPIDILINNAGITHFSSVADVHVGTIAQVMAVNFMGAVNCTKAALPDLLTRRGQVVALSSVAGFAPLFGRCAYAASKHALHGFFDTLRAETRDVGMNVLIVCPSFIATQRDDEEQAESLYAGTARPGSARATVGALLQPEDAARQIVVALEERRRQLLVGKVAKQSYWISRLWPRLYERLMIRQAGRELEARQQGD